jgi:8-oxo-dGTP pyrophosphatase MutT (NUDIX family)
MKLKEDADDHIRRETWEETGIEVNPGVPFYIWQWFMPDLDCPDRSAWVQAIAVARICRPLSSKPSTKYQVSGDHLSQARWVSIPEIPGFHLIPGVDDAFSRFLSLQKDEILSPLSAL